MLTSADKALMQADLDEIRLDNPTSITIRRSGSTLASQTVRLAYRGGSGQRRDGEASEQTTGGVIVLGPTTLNIQVGDRFNDAAGTLYEVHLVRPNRGQRVEAEAKVIQ